MIQSKNWFLLGHLAGSVHRAWDSQSQDCEFMSHTECRDFLKTKQNKIFKTVLSFYSIKLITESHYHEIFINEDDTGLANGTNEGNVTQKI